MEEEDMQINDDDGLTDSIFAFVDESQQQQVVESSTEEFNQQTNNADDSNEFQNFSQNGNDKEVGNFNSGDAVVGREFERFDVAQNDADKEQFVAKNDETVANENVVPTSTADGIAIAVPDVTTFVFQYSADGYHYYTDKVDAYYALDDAGYWYYQEVDGSFVLWDLQNNSVNIVDTGAKSGAVEESSSIAESESVLKRIENEAASTPATDVCSQIMQTDCSVSSSSNEVNQQQHASKKPFDSSTVVPVDAEGRAQYPRRSDGKPILPVGPDGKKVFPTGKDNKPLFPVDEFGYPTFPVGDDGQPVFPIGPQSKPIVPVDKNGRPVFPLDNAGMPIFPLGPDGKPTAPISLIDGRPVLPADQNGKPIVPYGPDGQPLIHIGPDNMPVEQPSFNNQQGAGGGDWGQYWNQYYQQYYNNYYNYYNPYPYPPTVPPGVPPNAFGNQPPFSNHSYVGFGSGVKKPKVRPEDIDLPAGPAPPPRRFYEESPPKPVQSYFPSDEGRFKSRFDNAAPSSTTGFGSIHSSPNAAPSVAGSSNEASPLFSSSNFADIGKKDSATKQKVLQQLKSFARFKKESDNAAFADCSRSSGGNGGVFTESKPSSVGGTPPSSTTGGADEQPATPKLLDTYGPKIPPPPGVALADMQKSDNEPSASLKFSRFEPPPPGVHDEVSSSNVSVPKLNVRQRSSRSRERSPSPDRSKQRRQSSSGSRSGSRSRQQKVARRSRSASRSKSRSRSRSRSRSPYRNDRDMYRSNWRRGGPSFREDRWSRGGNWRNNSGGRFSRYSPRGPLPPPPSNYRPRSRWQRSPSPERRRRSVERRSKTRSGSPSSSKSKVASECESVSSASSLHKEAEGKEKEASEKEKSPETKLPDVSQDMEEENESVEGASFISNGKPLVDYQPDEPIDEEQPAVAVALATPPADDLKVKVFDRELREIDWPKRFVCETRTVPILAYSCKPEMYESFVAFKKQYDEVQRSQQSTTKSKQEQDAILQPHKPISFGLARSDVVQLQRANVADAQSISVDQQASKWKPLSTEEQQTPSVQTVAVVVPVADFPIIKSVDNEVSIAAEVKESAVSNQQPVKKRKKHDEAPPKGEAEMENLEILRNAALLSMEKAQKDLAYYESIVKKTEVPKVVVASLKEDESTNEEPEPMPIVPVVKKAKKIHRKKKVMKRQKKHRKHIDDDEEESDDDSSSSEEERSKKKKKQAKKAKKRSKKDMKKVKRKHRKQHATSSDDDDEEEDRNEEFEEIATKKSVSPSHRSSRDKAAFGGRLSKENEFLSHQQLKRKKRTSEDPSVDDDDDEAAENLRKARRDIAYYETVVRQTEAPAAKVSSVKDYDSLNEEGRLSVDKKTKKVSRKRKLSKRQKKHLGGDDESDEESSSSEDEKARKKRKASKKAKKRSKKESKKSKSKHRKRQQVTSSEVDDDEEVEEEKVDDAKDNKGASAPSGSHSWMPKIHEIFLPSDNALLKSKNFYETMKTDGISGDGVPPPPPPPKDKRKKVSSSKASPPPPPPPPLPKKDSHSAKTALLPPGKSSQSMPMAQQQQQAMLFPVATYKPMPNAAYQLPQLSTVSSNYSNLKYSNLNR